MIERPSTLKYVKDTLVFLNRRLAPVKDDPIKAINNPILRRHKKNLSQWGVRVLLSRDKSILTPEQPLSVIAMAFLLHLPPRRQAEVALPV